MSTFLIVRLCSLAFFVYSWNVATSNYLYYLNDSKIRDMGDPANIETPQYYINDFCYQKIQLTSRKAAIISPWTTYFPPASQVCAMGVEEVSYPDYKLVITFKQLDLYKKLTNICLASRLDVYDQYDGQSLETIDRITDRYGICGTESERKYYETRITNFVLFKYETYNLPANISQYFEAVVTPFHYSQFCKDDEFRCSNQKCILSTLRCDSYNNCGDNSDEECSSSMKSTSSTCAILSGVIIALWYSLQ